MRGKVQVTMEKGPPPPGPEAKLPGQSISPKDFSFLGTGQILLWCGGVLGNRKASHVHLGSFGNTSQSLLARSWHEQPRKRALGSAVCRLPSAPMGLLVPSSVGSWAPGATGCGTPGGGAPDTGVPLPIPSFANQIPPFAKQTKYLQEGELEMENLFMLKGQL